MNLNPTPEEKAIGKDNFHAAVGSKLTRRDFLQASIAAATVSGGGLGAMYFGYEKIKGDPVRVGLIGTGDEGGILVGAHNPEYLRIVAIADIRPSNIERIFHGDPKNPGPRPGLLAKYPEWATEEQARKDVEVYDKDYRELLANSDVEAVIIAVPLHLHAKIAIEAMRAGKHVLTEKLMAHSVTECKEMARVAKETGKILATGHQRHYSVLYDNANTLVKQGLLGDIKFICAQWHRNNSWPDRDSWRKTIPKQDMEALEGKTKEWGYESVEQMCHWRLYNETGGGLMAELGSHQLDAASIFLGKVRPIAVQG